MQGKVHVALVLGSEGLAPAGSERSELNCCAHLGTSGATAASGRRQQHCRASSWGWGQMRIGTGDLKCGNVSNESGNYAKVPKLYYVNLQ